MRGFLPVRVDIVGFAVCVDCDEVTVTRINGKNGLEFCIARRIKHPLVYLDVTSLCPCPQRILKTQSSKYIFIL